MNIIVNGEKQRLNNESITVKELLKINNIEKVETVSVQINEEFVSSSEFETFKINENDTIDFLYFMGGGNR